MRLHLIRHPRPQIAPGICYGQRDLDLAPGELERVGTALGGQLPPGALLVSSPLLRCRRLAEALAPGRVRYEARLMEMDFGAWEGCRWDDIPRADIDAWALDPAGYHPGGAESLSEMAARVSACAADLSTLRQDVLVLVCHAGTMRLLQALARGLTPTDAARAASASAHDIAYGTIETLDFPAQGTLSCPAP